MTMKVKDLKLAVDMPKLPKAVPVFDLTAPTFAARRQGIEHITKVFGLGDMRMSETEHGVVMGNKDGDVEFFRASGAVWANNVSIAREHRSELRNWPGVKLGKRGDRRAQLDTGRAKAVIGEAMSLLDATGFIGRDAETSETVALDQVAQLDEKGNEISFGAGSATVTVDYTVAGLPVRGAGAKSVVFADPAKRGQGVRMTGAFHAWRPLGRARMVDLESQDKALAVGLLQDPELEPYADADHQIEITRLELCYLALPAFMHQGHLFPAFQVEGTVSDGARGAGFAFGRYHHAVAPKSYGKADLFAPYLATNPDGISPVGSDQRK